MEFRKLFTQGKSVVLVIPSKYMKALAWSPQTKVRVSLMPDRSLKITSADIDPYYNIDAKEN